MDLSGELTQTFLSFSRQKMIGEMWPRLCSSLNGLSDEQIWWRPNEASNSIGNLLLHLNGNVREWLLHVLGGFKNVRDRSSVFNERRTIPASELIATLDATLREVDALLQRLTPQDLLARHDIQVYKN